MGSTMMPAAGAGSVLRALRAAKGLTIGELATRSGVSPRTIGGIERGHVRRPHGGTLTALADGLGLDGVARTRLAAAVRTEHAPVGVPDLPPLTPHFTGRQDDLARLVAASHTPGGVVLVTGLPGVGKTTLAVRAATGLDARFPDGVRFIGLAGDPTLRPAAVAQRLLRSFGVEAFGDGAVREYRALMRQRRVLVVVDDAGAAAQVAPLLPADAAGFTVVTAGRPLDLPAARDRLILQPLSAVDGERALCRMLGEDVDAGAVAGYCGGLPLALRAAATRLITRPHASVERLAARLARPERVLDALSVRDAFARGYRLLPECARQALRTTPLSPGEGANALVAHGWATPQGEVHPLARAFAQSCR
ncbi:helix-turn-helix domain-containing protein [Virgisporangium aliadipatigenens]|nr:helix-turn-helix domain-containing protein [Virgisporangium aliadipatigenens]